VAKLKPCWLVWTINTRGITALRAVTTTQAKAAMYRKMALDEGDVFWSFAEKRDLDHFFYGGDVPTMPPKEEP
jgi:hypothetical protein